ncbi:MAG: TRAP transporter fused permease subunit [Deltaproteobacteria bacterium]|nr:MAG: TRAP transporter fused permease subunit [Deltaproteobacteria bacterium]
MSIEAEEKGLVRSRRHSGALGVLESILLISIPILGSIFILYIPQRLGIRVWVEQYLALFLGLTLVTTFLTTPATKRTLSDALPWYDVVLCFISLIVSVYAAINWPDIVDTGGIITPIRTALGIASVSLLLEVTRRFFGWTLVLLVIVFIFYALFTSLFPGPLYGRSINWQRLAISLYLDKNALFGITLKVAATIVLAFVVFGQFLFATGGGKSIIDFALTVFGKMKGGAAKVPVVASGAFGSLSGVAVANIYATGQLTIPLMKKHKVPPHVAGAIEAVASTGGLILPPVMGVVAFIMATFLNITYARVCIAAAIPAILYYLALYIQIDRFAARHGYERLPVKETPSFKKVVGEGWPFILPIAVLIYTLFVMGLEAETCALYSTGAIIIVSMFKKAHRLTLRRFLDALESSGQGILEISVVCAIAGFIIGVVMFTGLGFSLTQVLVSLCRGNLFLLLIFAALMCIILGMGMPIVTVYIIVAIIIAPVLTSLGISEMAAHMFVFYFGMLSFLTPPVMLSVYAAATLALANSWKTAWLGMRLGIAAYIVPFVFVYDPSLLANGLALQIAISSISAIIGIGMIAIGLEGYLSKALKWVQRILLVIGGLALLVPSATAKLIGLGLALLLFSWEWIRVRHLRQSQDIEC